MKNCIIGTFNVPEELTARLKGLSELNPYDFVSQMFCGTEEKGIRLNNGGNEVMLDKNKAFYGKILIEPEFFHSLPAVEQKLHGVEAFIISGTLVASKERVYALYRPFEEKISVIVEKYVIPEEISYRLFRRVRCVLSEDGEEGNLKLEVIRVYSLMQDGLGLKAKRDEVVVRKSKDGAIVKEKKWLYKPMHFATRAYPAVGEYIGKM